MIRLFIYFVELRWRRAAALQPAAARDIGHYIYCSPAAAGTWHVMTWHDMTCSQSPSCWYHYNSCVSRCWQCQDVRMFVRRKRNTKSCRWTFWKRTHIDRRTIFGACTLYCIVWYEVFELDGLDSRTEGYSLPYICPVSELQCGIMMIESMITVAIQRYYY